MRYQRILQEAVEKYASKVEIVTGKNLDNVVVESYDVPNDVISNALIALAWAMKVRGTPEFAHVRIADLPDDRQSKIWYPKLAVFNAIPRSTIEYIAVHELGHIAHLKGKSSQELKRMDHNLKEWVADYIAVQVVGTTKVPLISSRASQALGYVTGTLERLGLPFKEALPLLGYD